MRMHETKWLEKINKIIENNLDNPDFQLSDITTEMYISRTKLYRDLKRLTGMSPNRYIRKTRLRKAKEILESNTIHSISKVSMAVGFREAWYFSKLFYKEYNMLPSTYLKEVV